MNINERIKAVREEILLKENLLAKKSKIEEELKISEENLEKLKKQLEKEKKDVKKLEGISFSNLLATVCRNKEEKLQKEEQEYLEAKMKYDYCLDKVNNYKLDLERNTKRLRELDNCEKVLDELLKEKKSILKTSLSSDERKNIEDKEEKINELYKESVEIKEAMDSLNESSSLLEKAIDELKSASNWGLYDMLGGGLISSCIKHGKIDEAKKIINELSHSLEKLEKELNDVKVQLPLEELSISSIAYGFDVFFDNIFADASVQSNIKKSLDKLNENKKQLNDLKINLEEKEKYVLEEIKKIEVELNLFVEEKLV